MTYRERLFKLKELLEKSACLKIGGREHNGRDIYICNCCGCETNATFIHPDWSILYQQVGHFSDCNREELLKLLEGIVDDE